MQQLSCSSFDRQVERATDWTLQRAAKNTLREALRYVTAEQEAWISWLFAAVFQCFIWLKAPITGIFPLAHRQSGG